jgi:hypothetical protein
MDLSATNIYIIRCGGNDGNFKRSVLERIALKKHPVWAFKKAGNGNGKVYQNFVRDSQGAVGAICLFMPNGKRPICGVGIVKNVIENFSSPDHSILYQWFPAELTKESNWDTGLEMKSYYDITHISEDIFGYAKLLEHHKTMPGALKVIEPTDVEAHSYFATEVSNVLKYAKPIYNEDLIIL